MFSTPPPPFPVLLPRSPLRAKPRGINLCQEEDVAAFVQGSEIALLVVLSWRGGGGQICIVEPSEDYVHTELSQYITYYMFVPQSFSKNSLYTCKYTIVRLHSINHWRV